MADTPILIVGAGPTGLVLALRLARHGVPFRIIDRNSGPGQASRAMVVQSRTLEFYDQLGFGDEVVDRGIMVEAGHIREGGREVAKLPLREIGAGMSPFPFVLSYPQDDHERFLVEKLEAAGHKVEWGVALKEFTQDDRQVRAILDTAEGEQVCEAAYLCGCDGAHSPVRHGLGLGFPGGMYDQVFFVADVKIVGDWQRDLFMNLGSRDFALMLPVRSRGMQRLIGTVPAALRDRDGLTFEDIRPAAEPLLGVRVEGVNWFSTYHVSHRVADHFRVGRGFVLGDAAHIHSPAGGQGMNTGIGDAVNLSWKLSDVIRGRANPSILDTYEAERIGFARRLVATTDRVFRGAVAPGIGGRFLRMMVVPRVLPILLRVPSVRRTFYRTVSQIGIRYPTSPLSAGRAGRIRGGDRLPWVASSEGGNFASLRSLDWRVHVYGALKPAFQAVAAGLGLPIDTYPWDESARKAGLGRDAAYLVRPDGYVALASPDQEGGALTAIVRLAIAHARP